MQEILLEKKLTTDFTMGFELEAIWYGESSYDEIELFFSNEFRPGGDVHSDGSLNSDDYDDTPFEYSTPVLPVDMSTFQQIINFLYENNNNVFYVNDSCGFHHHISYPGITVEDVVWIMSKLALDNNMLNKLKQFEDNDFVTYWSKSGYLERLANAVNDFDFNTIVSCCNTEKYSLINVHSQKTLEWRGPRGFLENGNRNVIIKFYRRIWEFIKWMTDVLDEKEINGMDRDNFTEQVRAVLNSNSDSYHKLKGYKSDKKDPSKKMSPSTLDKTYHEIINNPKRLLDFVNSPIPLEQLIQLMYNKNRLGTRIVQLNNEFDAKSMKKMNNICYKYIPYRMLVQFGDSIDEDTKYNTSELTLKRLFSTSRMDGQSIYAENIVDVFFGLYKSIKPELFSTQTFKNRLDDSFVTNMAIKDVDLELLRTIMPYLNNIDSNVRKLIVTKYLNANNQGFSTSKLKEVIKICGSQPEVMRSVNSYLYRMAFSYPKEVIPLITFNEKSLFLYISKCKETYSSSQFYDIIKPTLISTGKISEEEFDNIDRELSKSNYQPSSQEIDHLYHDEEIVY